MLIEHAPILDSGDVLIRIAPELRDRIAVALGYKPDAEIPGGWEHGLFPAAVDRVAQMNPKPAGPSVKVYPTLAAQMRHALGKPLDDATPAQELAQQIFERLTGTKTTLKAVQPADAEHARSMALSQSAGSVLALSSGARRQTEPEPDRQLQLLREMTGNRGGAQAAAWSLSIDPVGVLAMSGDRQAELLRQQISADGLADDDRQAQLLRQQLAGATT